MRKILRLLPKPSHFAGAEWGAPSKDPATLSVRVALAFPDLYEVGMSYLGQKILAEAVNRHERFFAERVYAVPEEAARVLAEHDEPLCTLETDTPLGDMDVLAFHLTHELCYTNVLSMLDQAGLPLRAADRGLEHPLVLGGGGCAFNAEPLTPFLDALVLGDGEEVLPALLEIVERAKEEGLSRQELLRRFTRVTGVYVPSFFEDGQPLDPGYTQVEKAVVADLSTVAFPILSPVSCGQAVHDRLSLEIARGCTRGCRFCQAGMIYRPVRERGLKELDHLAAEGLAATGYEELSFLSLSTGDFSALETLFEQSAGRCLENQVAISLPSLRAGTLTPRMLTLMSRLRRTGATVAPEAGSARLRSVINKGITEEDVLSHASRLFEAGWQAIKLYFMIGLPTETDHDLEAIADLAVKVLRLAPQGTKRLQVTVALSTFVPKPHTPFQWEEQISRAETERRLGLVRGLLSRHKKITMRWHDPRMSWLEGVFSRGDRALAPVVERAYRLGALFCSWVDKLDLDPWMRAFEECGVDPDAYLAARHTDHHLPWEHLLSGVSRAFLLQERHRGLAGKSTPDCRYGSCLRCGACSMLCEDPELTTPDLSPKLNRREPEWKFGFAVTPPLAAPGAPPAPREEITHRAAHFRVWYAKTGPAAFLSQLELANVLERSLRRAGLKPSFSAGYHPLPLIGFGWALPVGVESRQEWFALFLREAVSNEELIRRLGPALPQGLTALRAETLGMGRKVPQPVAERFLLRFLTAPDEIQTRLAQWRDLMDRESFPWFSQTKRGSRTVDIRPMVLEASPEGPDALEIVFDWSENRYVSPLKLVGAVNPGIAATDYSLTKLAQMFS
ncbi:TIGR03960 family B12-binding radical SAM protein [Fundidesulfovibrio butyratiphilus]